MNQVIKFYITSFLKNQTYWTPIIIIFLQLNNLTLQEVFWVFTIGSIFSFLIEIPTGIIADLYGKRRSIIISKFGIFVSFVIFGFASNFWMFVMAQLLWELGNSFRSGTETAYTFDYIKQHPKGPGYTKVKGGQKFWARVSEAIATAVGGFLAVWLGYNWVFWIAAIPAFMNFILSLFWEEIKERKGKGVTIKESLNLAKDSIVELFRNKKLFVITINIMLFTAVLAAVNKFIQPYMNELKIPVEYFGLIYMGSLVITALAVKYSYLVEEKFGTVRTINVLSFLAVIPLVIVGYGYAAYGGVALLFLIIIIENIRSPIANNEFHLNVKSEQRATQGSILSLFKNLGKVIILPIAGLLTNTFDMFVAIMVMAGILLVNSIVFFIRKKSNPKSVNG